MACIYNFMCLSCGYFADVSGRNDTSYLCDTQTVYCRTCRRLTDIIIEYHLPDSYTQKERADYSDDYLNRCFGCNGKDFVNWSSGDPCPICGGTMKKSETPVLYGD